MIAPKLLVVACLAAVGLVAGCRSESRAAQQRPYPGRTVDATPAGVKALLREVAAYAIENPPDYPPLNGKLYPGAIPNNWQRSTLMVGVMALHKLTGEAAWHDAALQWARANRFEPLGTANPDGLCSGQVYLDLYEIHRDPAMLGPTGDELEQQLRDDPPGRVLWWWCDALFMSPPTMARYARLTGNARVLEQMDRMWWDVTAFLYDPAERLYSRDERYLLPPPTGQPRLSPNGRKIFWGRGNGWVFAGICRVLEQLPPDSPLRGRYEDLLRAMAARLIALQGPDGLWRTNLLDGDHYRQGEASCSAFFCYGLAWGLNRGLLDRDSVQPAVDRAWRGLVSLVGRDGRVAHCQAEDWAPGRPSCSRDFGAGAFLLAGCEVAQMLESAAPKAADARGPSPEAVE